ncbi:MAG: preprotein translocase subunit YajC [Oscillibacter sp.]|uniref:preprotein translocase subunit YajC n=1 Tax=Oscillibacter sp. TaxID=1945593 RepID=UPI0028A1C1DE|nr:preprotein translocase subunit YajC [Oscillibacter sp.]MEA4993007.1 preprotein translocase subunit YajC [Oscillibacter sp.]
MDPTTIMMLVVLIGVFYFMIIRPENKRKKAAQQLRDSLKKGDKLTTIGGIVGSIVQVNDDTIIIETSEDRVRVEITKWAVSTTGVQTSTDPKAKQKQESKSAEEPAAPAAEERSSEIEQPAGDGEKKSWDPEV